MTEQLPVDFSCQIDEIIDHGNRDYSLILKPEQPVPDFLPGQYLKFALDEHMPGLTWPDSRSFSIASPPGKRETLRITYAVKGLFTNRMEAELKAGSRVWIQMPFGNFTIMTDRDVCLLAGGTGITAFTAFLAGLTKTYSRKITLLYGVKHSDLLIYRPLVEIARRVCPTLSVYYLAEGDFEDPNFLKGRIEAKTAWNLVSEPLSTTYYLAGPPKMIHELRDDLQDLGLSPNKILSDAWDKL
jgi:ferredoxin-NADP reductase